MGYATQDEASAASQVHNTTTPTKNTQYMVTQGHTHIHQRHQRLISSWPLRSHTALLMAHTQRHT